ncbi:Cytochrome c, mono-and diheme variants [Roseivivax halotolerans]|uniref:Cytochrome c, mono-and diheme variants n=1 Tax=Roseivivax halotolerans TaxID=93684 RepID=A0A1I5ZEZ8_9RHOB|nr:cytochrome c [Roseivivax halotolerans]SFQ54717.1 Cytochrome c, mono-and diheme variants [Roseivivax halotolerans]
MLRKALAPLAILLLIAGGALWLTQPATVDAAEYDDLTGDPERGETVFIAAGCASCHYAPGAEDEARLILSGGQSFETEFGTFRAPNISPSPEAGIGNWMLAEFASAVTLGTAPDGSHYYPAFPYTAYTRLAPQDVADLWTHMQTLPASDAASEPHDLRFPYSIRASLGGWKALYLSDDWVMQDPEDETLERGRQLVEALAHCGECHTPRDALGGLDTSRWLSGAPNPSGDGQIPGISPSELDWSETDIAYYLETGFTPDYDSVGGHMVPVVNNFAQLPESDRQAVAAYLKALPAN